MTLGELVEQLVPFAEANNREGFSDKLDELFLGGCWGHHFDLLAERGHDVNSFAKDLRGLVWNALKTEREAIAILVEAQDRHWTFSTEMTERTRTLTGRSDP
jgi:hypothetical protein